MSQILFRGILSSTHSWAVVGTELCLALHNQGYDIGVQSVSGHKKIDDRLKPLIDHEKAQIGLGYTIPRNIQLINADKRAIIYNYETTRMPAGWAKMLNSHADIVLPSSNFAKQIFLQNNVQRAKLHVLPHGVDIEQFNPGVSPMDLNSKKYKFLCVAEPHARKGLDILLQAFAEEFASTENVMLVIKTSIKGQKRNHYEVDVRDLLRRVRRTYAMPEVKLVTEKFPSLGPLYTACDAFVTATRSECFGLPVLEAMACRLPVIATGYGGHTDFATKTNSFLVQYTMINAPKPMQYWHYDPKSKIAQPDKQHLRALMRYVFAHHDEAKKKADIAYQQVIPKYTWETVADQFAEIVNSTARRQKWGARYILNKTVPSENIKFTEKQAKQFEQSQEKSFRRVVADKRERAVQLQREIVTKQAELDKLLTQVTEVQQRQEDLEHKSLSNAFSGKISVVVLSYNTKSILQRCIESVQANTTVDYDLIVVDNASQDGSAEWLKTTKGVKLILNKENVGVSKGWNQAITKIHSQSDIVVLNSDVIVPRGWLRKLQQAAYNDKTIGVVGCRIKGMGPQRNHLLHTGAIIQRSGMGQENDWGIPLHDYGQCQINKKVQIVVGACMYIKREVWNIVGSFDEQFSPAYFEDSDMCLRIAQAGYKVFYCGGVTLQHEHGATSKANKLNVAQMLERNRTKFRKKWQQYLSKKDCGVTIKGPVYGPSGYAEAVRNLIIGLHEANVDVSMRPITSHPSEQKPKHNNINLVVRDAIDNPAEHDTVIVFYLADFFVHHFKGAKRRIGYTMLEVDGVPANWVQYCNNYLTELWVPSTFNAQTFKKSGVRIPIRVVPLGTDVDRYNPFIKALLPPTDKHRFLSVCEMGERKNVHMLMRAFQTEFKKNEPVELILKVYSNDPTINVEKELKQYDLRNVVLLSEFYDIHQIGSLFASADCFALPSSGEGWGLPYSEAMACGLPVIGTGWSANTDFMNHENSYLINVKQIISAVARCQLYTGFNWALPDEEHLRRLMRHVFQNRDEARLKGQKASRHILENYSLVKAGEIAKGYLIG